METPRRHYTPEQKVNILRQHLIERTPVSDLCDQHGTTLRGNVAIDAGMACNKGENTWNGNIFYAPKDAPPWMFLMFGRIAQEERWKKAVFERNVFVYGKWKGGAFLVNERRKDGFSQNTVRNNFYWPSSDQPSAQAYIDSAQKERGHEQGSIVADPQFRDPAKLNFRTAEGSPARTLGIEGVDVSGNGPREGFPFPNALTDAGK